MLNIKEIKIFIVASEKPKILKLTSLQLIVFSFSSFNKASFVNASLLSVKSQTNDSSTKPCSMPK